jgi:hypothetical protein
MRRGAPLRSSVQCFIVDGGTGGSGCEGGRRVGRGYDWPGGTGVVGVSRGVGGGYGCGGGGYMGASCGRVRGSGTRADR